MKNDINAIDGLEAFVKVKMGIKLSQEEIEIYNNYDDDEKKLIFDFINNPVFINDLNKITKKILNHQDNKCLSKKKR